MGSRVRVPYTPQTLPKVQCFRKRFALYVIYILAICQIIHALVDCRLLKHKHTNGLKPKRYHQTLPLMGATRLEVAEKYSDAGRVAPISDSVSSSTKRYHQTLPLSASSNGGDASRVGNFFSSLVSRERCSCYLVEFVFPSHFSIPTRDASPPLVIAFGA